MLVTFLTFVCALLCPTKIHNVKNVGLVFKTLMAIIVEEGFKLYAQWQESQKKSAVSTPTSTPSATPPASSSSNETTSL